MVEIFRNEYDWASNMYMRPTLIGGITYASNEHFFASCKTVVGQESQAIINAPTPWSAKSLGKKCTLRPDWNDIRIHIMAYGLYHKFFQHADLREKLLSCYHEGMEEGNWWHDNFWGNCTYTHKFMGKPCPRCQNVEGQNKLGKLLVATGVYFRSFNGINS